MLHSNALEAVGSCGKPTRSVYARNDDVVTIKWGKRDWTGKTSTACSPSTMGWLSEHETLEQCEAKAVGDANCSSSKTLAWEQGSLYNCFCANTTCGVVHSTWLQLWTQHQQELVDAPANLTSTGELYRPTPSVGSAPGCCTTNFGAIPGNKSSDTHK